MSLTAPRNSILPEHERPGTASKGRAGRSAPPDSLILETEGVLTAWRRIQARARDLERVEAPA